MNKFQPKIADFGYEIMDAVSNGLKLQNVRDWVLQLEIFQLISRFNDNTYGYTLLSESLRRKLSSASVRTELSSSNRE